MDKITLTRLDMYFGQIGIPIRKLDVSNRFQIPAEYISVIATRNQYNLRYMLKDFSITDGYVCYNGKLAFKIDKKALSDDYERTSISTENINLEILNKTLYFKKIKEGKELRVYAALDWIKKPQTLDNCFDCVMDDGRRVLLPSHAIELLNTTDKQVRIEGSEKGDYFSIRKS